MKKSHLSLGVSCFLCIALLWGCGGGGPGAPGSTNSEDTGIRITAVNVTCPSTSVTCQDVDVQRSAGVTRTDVILNISSQKLNPNSEFDPFPASVEQCHITYTKSVEDPSSPTLEDLNVFPNCTINGGTISSPDECPVTLIDIQRKIDYWTALLGGINKPREYPTHYVAKLNCTYINNLSKTGTFQTEYDIWLGDYPDQ